METFIAVAVVIVLIVFAILIYNTLVRLRQSVSQASSDIDVQLKQRHDLIPNLVEAVRGYAIHERETLQAVTEARARAIAALGTSAQTQTQIHLSETVARVIGLAEAYPNLKASGNFQQLQAELSDSENKISAARRFYNNSCSEYNAAVDQFPTIIFSRLFGFQPLDFFQAEAAERQTPSVRF